MGVPPNHPFIVGFLIINHPFWDTSMEKPICRWPQLVFQGNLPRWNSPAQVKCWVSSWRSLWRWLWVGGFSSHGCHLQRLPDVEELWMIVNKILAFFRRIQISLIVDDSTTFFPGTCILFIFEVLSSWNEYTFFLLLWLEWHWKVSSLKDGGGRYSHTHMEGQAVLGISGG